MNENKWKVLVIDDEAGIRKVLSITLADAGYEVFTAVDGESGILLCREESPQIVFTDIRLPGIDGIEVLKRIKKEYHDVEVIVVTAFGEMEIAVKALQLNASDFITKPIDNDALLVALERAKKRYTTNKELHDYTELIENRWMDTAEELAKTFDYQNNMIESSMDGILGFDKVGTVLTYNRCMEKMLGYTKDEVIKKMSFDQFFPPGSAQGLKEVLYSEDYGGMGRLFLFETELLIKTGEKIPVQLSMILLHEGGQEVGMVGFFRDLREIRRMEQQFADQTRILHQHKMMSLGRLAASVVHEINNPLAGVLNYIRLMIKIVNRGEPDADSIGKFKKYLDVVENETERCSKIISNLLAFSRKSQLQFAEVDINELIERCIMLSNHKLILQNIEAVLELSPARPRIWGDYNQIQQCVINLIFNAIDAMPKGGKIVLKSSIDSRDRLAEIRIEDNGSGIGPEDMPHIFDPFYTTKIEGEGLGLGLSTVYGIIDRHKGTITVESRLGKGTVFTIKIPVDPVKS
jgi:PAS domain S-box-containing protein